MQANKAIGRMGVDSGNRSPSLNMAPEWDYSFAAASDARERTTFRMAALSVRMIQERMA